MGHDGYFLTGQLITDGTVINDGVLAVEHGRINYAGPAADFEANGWSALAGPGTGAVIVPGLVDLHCHGAVGADFSTSTEQSIRTALEYLHGNGTTTLLASLVAAPPTHLLGSIAVHRKLAKEGLIAGIHLEGPFLSRVRCGAQNPRWLRSPDISETEALISTAGGWLKTMTYAPELPAAAELVAALAVAGVVPSLGHTDCDAETAAESLVQAATVLRADGGEGRPTVTHLFNGMPPMHHRAPGPVPACLHLARAGDAVVELIADDVHLAMETVRSVFALVGAANIALVSDSMAGTGLGDGCYVLGPATVTVKNAVARLERGLSDAATAPGAAPPAGPKYGTISLTGPLHDDPAASAPRTDQHQPAGPLAGGTATLLQILQRTVAAGVSLAEAVTAATRTPAAVLSLSGEIGSLRPGMCADALLLSADLQLHTVIRGGALRPDPMTTA